ncbi:MAG: LacI family DNA-binding transcriptional regulator [Bacillota bacterium]|nr:LacI family DNA-binding transcriptional regulator [Bacillota bacterium]
MTGIKKVAARAGVSIATVSNVINGTRNVSEPLRQRVLTAINELGYQADPLASHMKKKHTRTIGLITTRITSLFYPYVIDGINQVIETAGYDLVLHDTRDDPEREISCIRRLVQSRVSGIILDTSHDKNDETYFLNLSGLSHRGYHTPVVGLELDLSHYGLDSVFVDGTEGGCLATGHLISCGCSRIAHITGPLHSSLTKDRLLGYRRALAQSGMTFDEALVTAGDFSQLSGYRATGRLLAQDIAFDGIFAANDQMAAGACHALRERSLKIPEDIRLVGYDNTFVASVVRPSISTIDVPKTEMGRQAAACLIDRIEGSATDAMPRAVRLPASLVIRETTRRDADPDWALFDW